MILDEIPALLEDSGVSPVFSGAFPATGADTAACVFEYSGSSPVRAKGRTAALSERPRFQVVCRAKSYSEARRLASRAFAALDGFRGDVSVTGAGTPPTFYSQIRALQSPYFLDRDDAGRARISANYEAWKEFSPVS